MKRATLSLVLITSAILGVVLFTVAQTGDKKDAHIENRPKVPGKLRLNLRERREKSDPVLLGFR